VTDTQPHSAFRHRLDQETVFWRRAVHDPELIGARVGRLLSPSVAFVDLHRDPARSLFVIGSARSGTTWLAEMLVRLFGCRFIFEPLRTESVPLAAPVRFGQYLDPEARPDPEVARVLDRVAAGRVRSRWSDRLNTARLADRRLVKEIRATNLLPWMARRYPHTPLVYLLRHPVPSALSVTELDWPDKLDQLLGQPLLLDGPLAALRPVIADAASSTDRFHRFVLRWCLENFVPTEMLAPTQAHVVYYEHLVADPRHELVRLRAYLERIDPRRWAMPVDSATDLERPSATNYRDTDVSAGVARLGGWRGEVPPAPLAAALDLVGAFGLDRLYRHSPEPRVDPDDVVRGERSGTGGG
jgi:hypothetical protein